MYADYCNGTVVKCRAIGFDIETGAFFIFKPISSSTNPIFLFVRLSDTVQIIAVLKTTKMLVFLNAMTAISVQSESGTDDDNDLPKTYDAILPIGKQSQFSFYVYLCVCVVNQGGGGNRSIAT